MRLAALVFLAFLLALSGAQGGVVYTNGPIHGGSGGYAINSPFQESATFSLAQPAAITGFSFGIWLEPGSYTLDSVQWKIGVTQYDDWISSGSSSVTSTPQFVNTQLFRIVEAVVSGLNVPMSTAGTYWLTLGGAVTSNGSWAYWDTNFGPSEARHNAIGVINSPSFTVYGNSVPEPAAIGLTALGLVLVVFRMRRPHAKV